MREFEIKARGKLNLGLDVTGVRQDGYHLVRMVMQTVRLSDSLVFTKTRGSDITIRTNLRYLPVNENNLIYKAVELVRNEYGISDGIRVELEKHIPVAAGMAGGSADAAAALKAMNRLFGLGIGDDALAGMGLRLGADVPYCLMGGTALAEGIGEELTPLKAVPEADVVLVKPNFSISTAEVYRELDSLPSAPHPDIDGMLEAIKAGDLAGICGKFGNILQTVSAQKYPVIEDIRQQLLEFGAVNSLMSGSGPTVFAIFNDRKKAEHAYYHFKGGEFGRNTFLTGFWRQDGRRA